MEVRGQYNPPTASPTPPREENEPGTHWIGGLAGPRACLDILEKRKTFRVGIWNPDCPDLRLVATPTALFGSEVL